MKSGDNVSNVKKKKKGRGKQNLTLIIFFCICIIIGGFLGYFLGKSNKKIYSNPSHLFLQYIVFIIFLYFSSFLQIVIHEGGHLIFGLLSGYKFISFRIFNFILIRNHGKFKIKRFKIKGTGGQCLLEPPDKINGVIPYKLYNLGGILMNFVFSSISLIIVLTFNLNVYINLFLYIFAVIGYFLTLTNGIPIRIQGMPNDGYNEFCIGKDKNAINGLYVMLKVNALISSGVRPKDLPLYLFELPQDINLNNTFNASIKIMEASVYDDKHDFKSARLILESLLSEDIELIPMYENTAKIIVAFYEIMDKCNIEVIEEIYDEDLKRFVKSTKGTLSFKRFEYAYALIVEKDEEKARKIYNKFEKICKAHPNISEIISEKEIFEMVSEKYLNIKALN